MDGNKVRTIYSAIHFLVTIGCLTILSLSACTSEQIKRIKTEQIEMYELREVNGEYQEGALSFAESYVYDENGDKLDHRIRQSDNSLHREKYVYKDSQLVKSNYYAADSSLLSFYLYEYENGEIKTKYAYEAGTQELLRIDEYEYNTEGRISKQIIKNANGTLSRTMAFGYDNFGNEQQVSIRDDSGILIVNEEFKITEYDVNKRWLERWSFNNDTPLTKRKRILEYYD